MGADFWTEKQMASSAYPADVATKLAEHATDNNTHEVWGANASIIVPAEGNVEVTFSYRGWSGSNLGMTILGVDVVDGEYNVVKGDYHVGFAGGTPNNNVYTLEGVPAGNYTIRYFVCNRTNGDHKLDRTAGKVLVKGANLPVVTSLDETKVYRLKSGHADFYLEIADFTQSSGEGALQFKKKANNSGQFFALEKTTDDQYHLKSVKDGTIYYVNANTWNFFAKTTAPEEGFSVYNIGNNRYAFLQTYAKHNGGDQHGYLGNTNGASEKGKIFNNQPYNAEDGISWIFEEVNVADLKATAKAELDNLAKLTAVYPDATSAKGEIDNVTAGSSLAEVETAVKQMDQIIVNYKKLADGKDLKFTNHGSDDRNGKYLGYDKPNTRAAAVASSGDDVIWTLKVQDNGSFKLYNFVHNVYLGVPADPTPVITAEKDAPAFDFIVTDNDKAALVTGGKMVHVANHTNFKLIQYYSISDGASLWTIAQAGDIVVTREQYDAAAAAKEALPYAIQKAYGLVTDAAKYTSNALQQNPAEGSYANLLDNNYQSYFHTSWSAVIGADHYLQAEVSEEVKDFSFYFKKRHDTNNNRPTEIEILGSSDGSVFTTIETISEGLPTDGSQIDYFSGTISAKNIKYIRFVVKSTNSGDLDNKYSQENPKPEGHPFFHFSEFYTLPAINDVTNLFAAYNTFATLSITDDAMATTATALINAEATLALANIKKEAQAILTANADKYEENPVLGKYPTATYEALQNACDNGTTEAEIRTAIDNFTKSLNKPVYIITSAWDAGYPGGSSIYFDGAWKWKKANKFDRQMWMTIPGYTEANVPVVDKYDAAGTSYAICDYLTGTKMRGKDVQIVKVPSWEGAYSLQYNADGENLDAAQHAKDNGTLVNWKAALVNDRQASAWRVEYVGNTYDLDQLTDEYLSALSALEVAVTTNLNLRNAEEGEGLGQYKSDLDPMKEALLYGGQTISLNFAALLTEINDNKITLQQIQNCTKTLTETELSINLPAEGYYRIKGANNNVNPYAYYLTGKTNGDGGRIALQAEADASTVFHYKDGKLRAVQSGLYVGLNSANYTFQLYANNAPTMTFGASTHAAGAYTIRSDRYLHYKVYNGEVELDRCDQNDANDAWYLEAVAEDAVPASNVLTEIDAIDANATYRIYGQRGFIYVADDGNMKSTYNVGATYNPNNDKHHFAIVTIGENKYLYNVGAKKFVKKNGTGGVALTDWPELAITIESKEKANENVGFDWVIKSDGNRLNLSNAGGHTFGIYTNYNTEDAGNVWAIYKVGTFDPAEAQSMKKVTINYTVDGQAFTKNYGVAAGNALNFAYDFATVKSCKVGEEEHEITDGACSVTVQDNMTIDVDIDQDLPFEATMNESKIPSLTWYYLLMHSNNKKYIQYLSDQTYIEWADAEVGEGASNIASHSWAFVGNVVEGFKMINFEARTTKALKATNNNPSMANLADGTAFVLSYSDQNVDGGFCMKRPDSDNYLNAQSGKVAYWSDNDAGSTFIATPSSVVPTRGKFYRIKNNGETGYLSSGTSGRTQFKADIENAASSIFYYDGDRKLLSYDNGMYIDKDGGQLKYAANPGEGISFDFVGSAVADRLQIHYYTTEHRYLYSNGVGGTNAGRDAGYTSTAEYRFIVEEVTTLPVTVSAAGYATFIAPVALQIPDGVKAYTGVVNGNWLTLEEVPNGTIPANTGVVLESQFAENEEKAVRNFNFKIVSDVDPITSHLVGSTAAKVNEYKGVTDEKTAIPYYTLQQELDENEQPTGNLVFMQYNGNLLAGSKAYLVLSEGQKSIGIRFEGTTDIEHSEIRNQK